MFNISLCKNALFCITCRLFGGSTKLKVKGLTDWRNVNKLLKQHQGTDEHTNCQIVLLRKSNNIGRIDMCKQINEENDYWKNIFFFFL